MPSTETTIDLRNEVVLGGAQFSVTGSSDGSIGVPGSEDDDRSLRMIRSAYGAGIRVFDSALAYAPIGQSFPKELFRRALDRAPDVVIATKGGHWRTGKRDFPVDNRPELLRRDVDENLRALGVDRLPLSHMHRVDLGDLPIEDRVSALEELRVAGSSSGSGPRMPPPTRFGVRPPPPMLPPRRIASPSAKCSIPRSTRSAWSSAPGGSRPRAKPEPSVPNRGTTNSRPRTSRIACVIGNRKEVRRAPDPPPCIEPEPRS